MLRDNTRCIRWPLFFIRRSIFGLMECVMTSSIKSNGLLKRAEFAVAYEMHLSSARTGVILVSTVPMLARCRSQREQICVCLCNTGQWDETKGPSFRPWEPLPRLFWYHHVFQRRSRRRRTRRVWCRSRSREGRRKRRRRTVTKRTVGKLGVGREDSRGYAGPVSVTGREAGTAK